MDAIVNFIALGAIAEIDNYYAVSLSKCKLKKALDEPPEIENTTMQMSFWLLDWRGKVIRVFYKFYRILYVSIYFYFTPYITTVLTYLIAGSK
jgi:hypothetical protein